ncbi:hypothetical protein CC80DRAFT_141083 [Byssothecium circinans]|uniref:Extracellular membrane protein CFEM domain-containing protein n=1 Tax=Byssothecium circinans TaxID=147558 RepID=A0A6A5TL03_9PLEO|nr:hypothetical protein CC80DRAFT_141083 [Byssothecium circinans]
MAPVYSIIIILLFALVANAELINPKEIPLGACGAQSCWYDASRPDQIGPCGIDTTGCPPDSKNCGFYDSKCYCQQTTQLRCAWSPCSWWNWMLVEDWFFKKCPGAPTVDFDKAPKCAAQCLAEKAIDYGCLTRNTNCFCIHADLFECNYNCHGKDKELLKSWLMDTCKISEARAEAGVTGSGFWEGADPQSGDKNEPIFVERKRRKPRWYEGMAFAILGASFLTVVGFFLWMR